jgi:hypothetical protein
MPESFRGLRKFFNRSELWDAGIDSRQDAKNAKLKEVFLGGLCAFARDHPRLAGVRGAPHEKPSCPSRLRGESYFSHW